MIFWSLPKTSTPVRMLPWLSSSYWLKRVLESLSLKFSSTTVNYLGYKLSQNVRCLTQKRVQIILDTKRPATKHALIAFLGLMNYCGQCIPDCSFYDKQLRAAIAHTEPLHTLLLWTDDMNSAYDSIKRSVCAAPALGLLTILNLFISLYLSKTLDLVAQGLPACLRRIAVVH